MGDWDFTPATGELRRRSDVRRLEPRAAKVLELLCDAGGDVVTHERLIERVWGGRNLSENSIAVVIGQLRRALDDDPREPRLIQTIPKRGYRLVERTGRDSAAASHRRPAIAIGALALLAMAMAIALVRPAAPAIAVADVRNETGDPRFDPLSRATSELIVDRLSRRGFSIRRGSDAVTQLTSKLVMWDGAPFLGMTATDATGTVIWSAMLPASSGRIPSGVEKAVEGLEARVAERSARR